MNEIGKTEVTDRPMKHGRWGYDKHCRCDVCRLAKSQGAKRFHVKYKHATPEQLASCSFPHGTEKGYTRGCRCRECCRATTLVTMISREKYRHNNPHRIREHNWTMKGVTMRGKPFRYCDYEKMFEHQGQRCSICGKILLKQNGLRGKQSAANVDHDHQTGEVRGLLCSMCNHLLGYATDSEDVLLKAVEYLRIYHASRMEGQYKEV